MYHEENPAGRAVNFDSVIDASMAIVQTITFDTWSDVMYDLMEAFSWYVLITSRLRPDGGLLLVRPDGR